MKRLGLFLLLIILFIPAFLPATTAATDLAISPADRELGRSLIRRAVANFFGVSESVVEPFIPSTAPEQVFPTFFLAAESGSTPAQIWEQKGRGWGKLAKSLGLPANFHGKYISNQHKKKATPLTEVDNATFEELLSLRFMKQYYDKDPDSYASWRAQGLGYEDLMIGSNLAARTNKRQGEFFRQRLEGKNWATIARENNLSYGTLAQPVAPQTTLQVTTAANPSPAPNGKTKGPAKEKGPKNKSK